MEKKIITHEIELPEGVTAEIKQEIISISGPKGTVSRKLFAPFIKINSEPGKITVASVKPATKREKKLIGTFKAHIKNLVKGVTEGIVYKLKICSGHFPMSVAVSNNTFSVKNFLGEKVPRTFVVKEGVDVKIDGEIIIVNGIDKELVSQTAASIEQLTKIKKKDRRIFQDGIWMISKDGKEIK